MEITGFLCIAAGLYFLAFDKHPTREEEELETALRDIKQSKSMKLLVIDQPGSECRAYHPRGFDAYRVTRRYYDD